MRTRGRQLRSCWQAEDPVRRRVYPPLQGDLQVDVAVVGGGIAGLTAALLLKRAGKTVALIEEDRIASGDSGRTTAHLTEVLDARYFDLAEDFGDEGAKRAAESKRAAIDRIELFTRQLAIDCGFERVPGFLFTETRSGARELKRELKAARRLGIAASLLREVPFPGERVRAALRFENQAQFSPLPYLAALAAKIDGEGCHVFERTQASSIEDGEPCRVVTSSGVVTAGDVVVATHSPVCNRFILHTKIAAYRSYVLAARPRKPVPLEGLYWDTQDPYHYVRRWGELLLIGGEDHKTGLERDPSSSFERLEQWSRERFDLASIEHRWSAQVHEPVDGLPYIGRNPLSERLYVGTGFAGNGMTFGTLAGMILSDQILGIENSWSELYQPSRIKPLASAASYVRENKDVPMCFVGDRVRPPEATRLSQIAPGEGKIMRIEGKRVAVYRDPEGQVRACSAVCTHMGCIVRWNNAESSWDCPCHGSRFDPNGKVLNGPAPAGLEAVPLEEVKESDSQKAA